MPRSLFGLAVLFFVSCGICAPAGAASVTGATTIHIIRAEPTGVPGGELAIGEVIAIEEGTGTNVALAANGATTGILPGDSFAGVALPGFAIDGIYPASYPGIYHSLAYDGTSFLDVMLASPTNLASLTIYGRADCCKERDFYSVQIFNAASALLYAGTIDARVDGFGTVTFDAVAPVPLPAALPLFAGGLGLLGWMARRKKRATPSCCAQGKFLSN